MIIIIGNNRLSSFCAVDGNINLHRVDMMMDRMKKILRFCSYLFTWNFAHYGILHTTSSSLTPATLTSLYHILLLVSALW